MLARESDELMSSRELLLLLPLPLLLLLLPRAVLRLLLMLLPMIRLSTLGIPSAAEVMDSVLAAFVKERRSWAARCVFPDCKG